MATEIVIAGTDEELMLQEALERLKLPREAVSYEIRSEAEEDLLPGARPQFQMHIRIRPEYLGEQAAGHLRAILDIVNIESEVQTEVRDEMVFVRVRTRSGASILIGRDGQNLDALQYLIARMVLRSSRDAPMMIVDVENYRGRQFSRLERLADRALDRARKTGNEIEMDPMPAIERKYLHYYLRNKPGVRTFSRGEEPERCLVLLAD
jgi:spoIIIJ-associated protein